MDDRAKPLYWPIAALEGWPSSSAAARSEEGDGDMTDVILDQATLDQLRLLPGRTHPQLLTEVSAVFFYDSKQGLT